MSEFTGEPSETFRMFESEGRNGALRFRVDVPPDCPYFRGHFPDHPVLPAIAQLALLQELIRRAGHPTARLVGIEVLRLRRPVTPGQTIEAELRLGTSDAPLQFEFLSDGDSVAQGSVRWTVETTR